jgi:hypothetical protein
VLLLATNDIDSLASRVLGSRWPHLHRAHLWFFSRKTLATLVETLGLEVIGVRTAHRVYNLDYVASILARGTNFALARSVSKALLRTCPAPLRIQPWPPLPEGFALLARRPLVDQHGAAATRFRNVDLLDVQV